MDDYDQRKTQNISTKQCKKAYIRNDGYIHKIKEFPNHSRVLLK